MCGRFTLSTPAAVIAERYRFTDGPALAPRYNIAPSQPVAVVRTIPGAKGIDAPRELSLLRWGLVPSWAKEPRGDGHINARAETITEKPAFRSAFRSRRCLIPADGYYEWRSEAGRKQPYLFRRRDRAPFAFAGLWDLWVGPDGEPLESCAFVTTEANELTRPVHDRAPVVLSDDEADRWLDPSVKDPRSFAELLRPWEPAEFVCVPVGRSVNRVDVEGPDLTEPVRAEPTLWDAGA